ncbi:hypothetical protein [Vibrio sp. D431a]|uniref:hypothetical protein n=1 Tax=Vibrio sp. D431a TaxID=2837388 RepID=UPI0025575BCE|nr:hypothetical protein [Vibrio sp. D431a]MDK9790594.1 hypothetical protein [Vibrio sp. D431a]
MSSYHKLSDVIGNCDLALKAINSTENEYIYQAATVVACKTGHSLDICEEYVRDAINNEPSEFSDLRMHVKGFKNSLFTKSSEVLLSPKQMKIYHGIKEVAGIEHNSVI